jgi:hypothetical protein
MGVVQAWRSTVRELHDYPVRMVKAERASTLAFHLVLPINCVGRSMEKHHHRLFWSTWNEWRKATTRMISKAPRRRCLPQEKPQLKLLSNTDRRLILIF